jgi:hypothetical protein
MLPDMEPSSELNSALTSKNKKVQQMNVQVDLRILLPEKSLFSELRYDLPQWLPRLMT